MRDGDYVFGFGSLVRLTDLATFLGRAPFADDEFAHCHLREHRRSWNIARDNLMDLPKRPHFVCPDSGERLAVFVTVLNIRAQAGAAVNGIAFRVSESELAKLDHREASYDRIEMTGATDVALPGRLWAYRGKAAAERRYKIGVAAGTAVVNQAYHESVVTGFADHGTDFVDRYHATTDAPAVPLRPLRRVEPI